MSTRQKLIIFASGLQSNRGGKQYIVLSFMIIISFLLFGCSFTPTESDARKIFENEGKEEIESGTVSIKSFRKIDGQSSEMMGVKMYKMSFEAEVELLKNCQKGKKGQIVKIKNSIYFEKFEKGWKWSSDGMFFHPIPKEGVKVRAVSERKESLPAGKPSEPVPSEPRMIVYEAENASLYGSAKVNNEHSGYSGSGYVDGYGYQGLGAVTTFKVDIPSGGEYKVSLRYANAMGRTMTLSIFVNGRKVKQTHLPSLKNWDKWAEKTEILHLKESQNAISYRYDQGDTGNVNLDFISVSK